MTEIRAIVNVESFDIPGEEEHWAVRWVRPDGHDHIHLFPKSTLAQRVAEYDLDPEDVDTVLDIILHENYIEASTPSAGGRVKAVPTLYTAESPKAAREAHLARVEEVKKRLQFVSHTRQKLSVGFALHKSTTPEEDPLEMIRQNHGISPGEVAKRRDRVHRLRAEIHGETKAVPKMPATPSGVDPSSARRIQAMVEDPDNPKITIAPEWVTLTLEQE